MKNVRVWFSKTGAAQYISHLDLTRCMARALKLSGLPVWYTQGFNPRIYMTFAMPLSLGVKGERECMDIRLNDCVDFAQAARKLDACLPEDISILEISEPEHDFDAIGFGEYQLRLESDDLSKLARALAALLAESQIIVMKHSKKGEKAVDIKPHFIDIQIAQESDCLLLSLKATCSQGGSINPNLLVEALKAHLGEEVSAQITRKCLLTKDFSDMR